jgi:hypothetical protein
MTKIADQDVTAAEALADACNKLLTKPPLELQGEALAQLVGTWLSSHEGTALRSERLARLMRSVGANCGLGLSSMEDA